MAKCVAVFSGEGIEGSVTLSQSTEQQPTVITGTVSGLKAGAKLGFSIHVFGDVSQGGESTGAHFNPFGKNHGGRDDEERHVGSLGNVEVDDAGQTVIHIEDGLVKLIGPQSIIGRSLVISTREDDLGKGGHELSLVDGNAGPALAFGVVGISSN